MTIIATPKAFWFDFGAFSSLWILINSFIYHRISLCFSFPHSHRTAFAPSINIQNPPRIAENSKMNSIMDRLSGRIDQRV